MTNDEYKKLEDKSLPVYEIRISISANQLLLSCQRNELVYLMMTEQGRKGVDEIMNAMLEVGTATAVNDKFTTESETVLDLRENVTDFFDREVVIDDDN